MTRPKQDGYIKRRQDIIAMNRAGVSLSDIGKQYGITKQAVFQILHRCGETVTLRNPPAVIRPAPTIMDDRAKAAEGSKRLLKAMLAYYERHHWRRAA